MILLRVPEIRDLTHGVAGYHKMEREGIGT